MIVKICGITRFEDALQAAQAGADMLGFNFYRQSPRYLEPAAAGEITDRLRSALEGQKAPLMVGIFVNEAGSSISSVMDTAGLNVAQLAGDESDELLHELSGVAYKAIRPATMALALDDARYYRKEFINDERIPSLLLDAYHPKLYGGTGQEASIEVALAVKAEVPRLMLAGGLKPDNVAERIAQVRPWGVDVASGVEPDGQPGIKDAEKVAQFIRAAKQA